MVQKYGGEERLYTPAKSVGDSITNYHTNLLMITLIAMAVKHFLEETLLASITSMRKYELLK